MSGPEYTAGALTRDCRGYPHPDIKSLSGRNVATTWALGAQPKSREAYERRTAEDRANADRIVLCWNQHDDLVATARKAEQDAAELQAQLQAIKTAFIAFAPAGMRACLSTPAEPLLLDLHRAIWLRGMSPAELCAGADAQLGLRVPAPAAYRTEVAS